VDIFDNEILTRQIRQRWDNAIWKRRITPGIDVVSRNFDT